MNKKLLLVNGPNLNLLGRRKPEIYGTSTLRDVVELVQAKAKSLGYQVEDFQSNSEGAIIDALHAARETTAGVIINPGAYSHTSIAIRDAIEAIELPTIEVHISDIHQREAFRHHSYLSDVVHSVIVGRGVAGYEDAVQELVEVLKV